MELGSPFKGSYTVTVPGETKKVHYPQAVVTYPAVLTHQPQSKFLIEHWPPTSLAQLTGVTSRSAFPFTLYDCGRGMLSPYEASKDYLVEQEK